MSLGNPSPPVLDGSEDVSRGPTFLRVTWSVVTDAVKYTVHCNNVSQTFSQPNAPFQTSFNGLSSNSKHSLGLDVEDSDGNVKSSAVREIFTRPLQPSFLALATPAENARKPTSVVLIWQDVAGINIYEVERDSIDVRKTGGPGNLGFDFSGLLPNVMYTFRVRSRVEEASGRVDVSFNSDALSVLTRPPTPGPLTLIPQSGQQVGIAWPAIQAFNNSPQSKVQLGRSRGTNPADELRASADNLAAHIHVDNVVIGESLLYGVRVVVSGNESFWSLSTFKSLNASAILRNDAAQLQAQKDAGFMLSVLRGVNE